MKIILASVAGVEDGFFQMAWEKFPNLAFALALVYLTYKLVTFHRDFKQSLLDLSNSFHTYKADVAAAHDRMNKESAALKEKTDAHEIRLNQTEVTLAKTETKIDALHIEMNLRFDSVILRFDSVQKEMNLRFVSIQKEMDLRFQRVDERFTLLNREMDLRFDRVEKEMTLQFGDVNRRLGSLETKVDKVIDLLSSNREDNALSPLRKS